MMKSAMGDALKAMKGPGPAPMMDESAGEGFAAGGEKIDLSKIDPALIQAIIKELTESGMVEAKESPMELAAGEEPSGLNLNDKEKEQSDQAPSREAAISAIADGGAGHEAGGLRARAANKAKGDLASMKGKAKY